MTLPLFLEEAEQIRRELCEIRKTIHRHPEIGNREFQTSALVETYLKELGIETERMLGTAIVGTLRGAEAGPMVALRADMDALPIQENTGCDFASEVPGMMHACGHDVHTTALLGAAKLIAAHRGELKGSVRFLFQPDEEGKGGSARMIREGAMEGVEAVFGAHVDPQIPAGSVGVRYGKFYAASNSFQVTLHGKSAHGAEREKGIDALGAMCELVGLLLKLPEGLLPEKSVVTIGKMESGTVRNIIADTASIDGILRTLGPASQAFMKQAVRDAVDLICEKYGATADVYIEDTASGIVNTDPETAFVQSVAKELLGEDRTLVIPEPKMISEDFGFFVEKAGKGSFYHLGAGSIYSLHNDHFLPPEDALVIGAALHSSVAWKYLS
ncbi:MAG: amidohydrolase [Firmicutes bacterium]|nr:amidohydrolase [Bacillota bacterium]